jgi:hypothetical protein
MWPQVLDLEELLTSFIVHIAAFQHLGEFADNKATELSHNV